MIYWLDSHFDLWDIIIYRFFRPFGYPLSFYKKKVPKMHSYFLIFKVRK